MSKPESLQPDRTEQLVGLMFNAISGELTPQEKTTLWAYHVLGKYDSLSKQTSQERKRAKNLVRQTALELLKSPQNISIAEAEWIRNESNRDGTEDLEEQPFSKLVKVECLTLIKEKWQNVEPEQLAQLVRISSDINDPSQNHAKDLLRNYFSGPDSRDRRIDAYYNFMLGVLDLGEDKEAFRKGMEIALHATDILPKDRRLAEQTALLYFPYNVDETVFQNLLVSTRVVARVCSMGRWDLGKYYQEWKSFLLTHSLTKEEKDKRRESVMKGKKGNADIAVTYNTMEDSIRFIFDSSREPFFDEQVIMPKGAVYPLALAFDPSNPLSQKFQRIQLQLASSA